MKLENLREVLHAAPFQPFTIHVADGRSLPVRHPDFIAIGGNGRIIIVVSPPEVSPSYSVIDLPMINQLEVEGSPATAD